MLFTDRIMTEKNDKKIKEQKRFDKINQIKRVKGIAEI